MNWLPSHLYLLLPLLMLCLLLAALSRRLSERAWHILLRITLTTLLLCECVKQVLVLENYDPMYLPFHYSTTYYLCIALYAFGGEKLSHLGKCLLFPGGLLLFTSLLFGPFQVVGDVAPALLFSSFYNFYSLFYHLAVLLVFFSMLARREYAPSQWDPLFYAGFLISWGALAVPMAHLFRFNYAGILYSYIPLLEAFRLRAGDVWYLIIYLFGALLIATLSYYIYRGLRLMTENLRGKNEEKYI